MSNSESAWDVSATVCQHLLEELRQFVRLQEAIPADFAMFADSVAWVDLAPDSPFDRLAKDTADKRKHPVRHHLVILADLGEQLSNRRLRDLR
ncbi:hypothetical protein [Burkholderia lata]|uniref:hypothetical protein n=1 Tax=Burkholderia lata (strain ATCC 17760 / DSM 23089 / LMG 22485 / NCIMB 9086 / R18194 / 383) TaxID=482957 RepID=UPI00158260AC|nr:hypothetical protein [Burkholderia lata]